ncbi:MAG: pyridoxamine 5'-phosphate oxidase family protein [Ramlibacter sp.]|nr:pyridoxamine 5'-phosphate oxidase family protein [Ramlibacter sp.]
MTDQDMTHYTLWNIIKTTRFCMLTHRDADGQLHSQPLTTQNRSFDEGSPLYFFISRGSHLAQRIAQDDHVNVAYANTDADSYVSVSGSASLSSDRAQAERLWSPAVRAWFPGGLDDPDLALLIVWPHQAEFWDVKVSKVMQVLKMAKAALTGKPPRSLGEHQKLEAL